VSKMQRTGPSKRLIVMVVVDTLGRSPCLATEDARQAERDFETLVQPLLGPALRLAVAMLGDRSAAEDAVQEATLRTWRHLDQFREGSCLRSWYLAIVANQCRTLARGRWWRVLRVADPPERGGGAFEDSTAALMDMRRALAELSVDHRLVVCLHYYLDLPHEEIARLTGVRVGTVKSRLHRATVRLRARLDAPAAAP